MYERLSVKLLDCYMSLVTQMPKCRPLLELLHVSGLPLTASINDIEYILTEELRNF